MGVGWETQEWGGENIHDTERTTVLPTAQLWKGNDAEILCDIACDPIKYYSKPQRMLGVARGHYNPLQGRNVLSCSH